MIEPKEPNYDNELEPIEYNYCESHDACYGEECEECNAEAEEVAYDAYVDEQLFND